ncbi:hypothetical protein NQ036_03765 [Brevibacterium sp. 91QC2O2]|uniref:hypothetical protein n=1 Tax=Brevibacterium TaxID=1696 RepID=UPI00211CC972|nr:MULTISPECIES: hypothetical protein [unclassified Brevibacterium]MCQ9367364.1 hypothetical protein [Brevibacterium sp. 91QC2O2]MCQ9384623.1 hypothetical protein [Brevibacterium sp. 68QC2CO]
MPDLIAETLARHQAAMVHEAGPDIAMACECDDTYRTYRQHAAHQAEAVRAALLGDEAVEMAADAAATHTAMLGRTWRSAENMARAVLTAVTTKEEEE